MFQSLQTLGIKNNMQAKGTSKDDKYLVTLVKVNTTVVMFELYFVLLSF